MVRLTDRPDMTLDVYRGRKTTMQQQQNHANREDPNCTERLVSCFCDGKYGTRVSVTGDMP